MPRTYASLVTFVQSWGANWEPGGITGGSGSRSARTASQAAGSMG